MINAVVLTCLLFISVSADPFHNGFKVKWSNNPSDGDSFFDIPRTRAEAEAGTGLDAWILVEDSAADKPFVVFCQPDNERFCVIYDLQGIVAGAQYGIPAEDIANNIHQYPYDSTPAYQLTTRFGRDVYVGTAYFVSPDTLDAGGRSDLSQGTLVEYWQQRGPTYRDSVQIPLMPNDITANTAYKHENCVPTMGEHYYYNISSALPCESFYPWFMLYKQDQMTGMGFQSFGRSPVRPNMKHYDEEVPLAAVLYVLKDPPQCIRDWVTDDTVISLHIYVVDDPVSINTCGAA